MLLSASDEKLLQVTCAGAAEEVVDAKVGICGATTDQLRLLAEDFSSFLLLVLAVFALWRFVLSGDTLLPGIAAPLIGKRTCDPGTVPRAS